MFDVGFAEIFLLVLIGLIVLGPEKLPRVARTLGGMIRRARSSWYSLRRSIEAELAAADISEPLKETSKDIKDAARQVADAANKAANTKVTAEPGPAAGPEGKNEKQKTSDDG
ncbi:MAG: twin-arginine translocase subunit TatB [Xanthomonadales bacterium]|nr:twin-arginine translocase subunit TatB [Xanthomonadales bacterium]